MDLGGNGKFTAIDFVAWQLLLVFCGVSVAALYVFADRFYMNIHGESTEAMISYSIPLSQFRQNAESLMENGAVEITVSRLESIDPMWEGASCPCIASRMAFDSCR
jgi:hypothetical protein